MGYQSKYFNLDTYYANWARDKGWESEDLEFVLEKLENIDKNELIDFCVKNGFELYFNDIKWEKITTEFEIISIILTNSQPKNLSDLVKNL